MLIVPTQQKKLISTQKSRNQEKIESGDFLCKQQKQDLIQVEARFDDIPTPLLAHLVRTTVTDKGCYELLYETQLSFDDLKAFYDAELEKQGWEKGVLFAHGNECTISCKKKKRSCILSLAREQSFWGLRQSAKVRLLVQS